MQTGRPPRPYTAAVARLTIPSLRPQTLLQATLSNPAVAGLPLGLVAQTLLMWAFPSTMLVLTLTLWSDEFALAAKQGPLALLSRTIILFVLTSLTVPYPAQNLLTGLTWTVASMWVPILTVASVESSVRSPTMAVSTFTRLFPMWLKFPFVLASLWKTPLLLTMTLTRIFTLRTLPTRVVHLFRCPLLTLQCRLFTRSLLSSPRRTSPNPVTLSRPRPSDTGPQPA